MVKVYKMSEEGKRQLKEAGTKVIHRKSGDYVQPPESIRNKLRRKS